MENKNSIFEYLSNIITKYSNSDFAIHFQSYGLLSWLLNCACVNPDYSVHLVTSLVHSPVPLTFMLKFQHL